jgi:hypothetical protein
MQLSASIPADTADMSVDSGYDLQAFCRRNHAAAALDFFGRFTCHTTSVQPETFSGVHV